MSVAIHPPPAPTKTTQPPPSHAREKYSSSPKPQPSVMLQFPPLSLHSSSLPPITTSQPTSPKTQPSSTTPTSRNTMPSSSYSQRVTYSTTPSKPLSSATFAVAAA